LIRVSVKALIIRNEKILVLENRSGKLFYTLPGGGQNPGETMIQAIERECLEEISVQVKVGDLVLARDYIGAHHEFAEQHKELHQVELIFRCTIVAGESVSIGPIPDRDQIGLAWLPVKTLNEYPLFPKGIIPILMAMAQNKTSPVYLGDIN
jgi:8-oxo-dGTP diphosphatase